MIDPTDPDPTLEALRTCYALGGWFGELSEAVHEHLAAHPEPEPDVTITVTAAEARYFCDYYAVRAHPRPITAVRNALSNELTNRNPR